MKLHVKIAVAVSALALGAAPAFAFASSPGNSGNAPGHNRTQGTTHTTNTAAPTHPSTPPNEFGRLCRGESKKHVAGTPGTPFSKCVNALAKLANGSAKNP